MTNEIINQKIKALKDLEAEAATLKASIDAIKDELKAELDSRQVDSVDTGIHRVFYNMYEKKGVDTKKLKAAGLYDEYSSVSTVIQFRITDVNPA